MTGIQYDDFYSEKYIFHYTNVDSALEILEHLTLRLNRFQNMNDPLEFKDYMFTFSYNDKTTNLGLSNTEKGIASINDIRRNKLSIISFSICSEKPKNVFDHGYARSRMWSQYGDNHKGVCLVFEREELIAEVNNNLKDEYSNNPIVRESRINYTNSLEGLDTVCNHIIQENEFDPTKFIFENEKAIIFTKLKDYQDEQEYRISVYMDDYIYGNKNYIEVCPVLSLKAIIVGDRFNRIYIPNVEHYKKVRNIQLFQLDWTNRKPYLMDGVTF